MLTYLALIVSLLLTGGRVGEAAATTSATSTPSESPSPSLSPSPSMSPSPSPSPSPSMSPSPSATVAPPTPAPSPDPYPNLPICDGFDANGNRLPYTGTQPPPPPLPTPTPAPTPQPGNPCQCMYLDPVTGQVKPSPTNSKECIPPRPEIKERQCVASSEGSYDSHYCDTDCKLVPSKRSAYIDCPNTPNNCPASFTGAYAGWEATKCTLCKYRDDVTGQWTTSCPADIKTIDVQVTVSCQARDVVIQSAFPGQDGQAGADPNSCFEIKTPGTPPNTCSPGTCSWATKSAASGCMQITTYQGECELKQPGGGGGAGGDLTTALPTRREAGPTQKAKMSGVW